MAKQAIQTENERRTRYHQKYEKFLLDAHQHEQQARRTLELGLTIQNGGTAPATNLDIAISFPSGLIVQAQEHWEVPPEEPPEPVGGYYGSGSGLPKLVNTSSLWGIAQNVSPLIVEAGKHDGMILRMRLRRVSHGQSERTPRFRIKFPMEGSAQSFQAEYAIRADELIGVEEGTLFFVVNEKGVEGASES